MKYLEILRAKLAELAEARSQRFAEMEAITEAAATEERTALNDTEEAAFEEARSAVADLDAEIEKLSARCDELEKVAERSTNAIPVPQIVRKPDTVDVLNDRNATPTQLADAAMRSLEENITSDDNKAHVRSVLNRHKADTDWARGILLRSTDVYAEAWFKLMTGREFTLTAEERTALGVSTNANGKYMLPTHLDPTIILTSSLSTNEIRRIARVVTLTDGQPAWNGITSAGVTASWDGELAEVSDDSPTVGQPSITTTRAQAFVQASISATQDIKGLTDDLLMMFADAKDRLEGAAHCTGTGSSQPTGVFTAVAAVTASRVTSTTAATIGTVDLKSVYTGVPKRYRHKMAKWVANPLYILAVKELGTAVSASYSGDLRDGLTPSILDREVIETDDAPTTQTTTALDQEILFGDFSQYVIVDRPGDMSVEYIPHLFNTANNLPDGRRGWYASWRNGADVTNVNAFRLLVDKTTA